MHLVDLHILQPTSGGVKPSGLGQLLIDLGEMTAQNDRYLIARHDDFVMSTLSILFSCFV